jgi:hypothetical protein
MRVQQGSSRVRVNRGRGTSFEATTPAVSLRRPQGGVARGFLTPAMRARASWAHTTSNNQRRIL